MFEEEYGDSVDRYAIDTLHTDVNSYTYTLKWNGNAWAYDETGFNAAAGKNLYMVHTRHSSNDKWTVVTEATCTTAGERTRRCSHLAAARANYTRCNYVIREVIPATGHTWGEWVITEATCTEDGKKVRTCSACGETETEVIPATGTHTWGEWTIDGENHVRECSVCHEKETEAHKWDKGVVTTAPHLDSEGEKTFTCTVCSHTKTEVIPVPAPITNEIVEHERQPGFIYVLENWKPTGSPAYAGRLEKEDGARQIKSRRLIPGTYEIGKPYEEDGKFYCVVTVTDLQAYLAAFQARYPGITWKIDTANCRTSYRYLLEYIGYDYPADPCSWRYTRSLKDENGNDTSRLWIIHEHYTNGEWKVTKEATCTEDGEKTAICSHNGRTESWSSIYKCKTTMTETIPAIGEHSWGEWEVTTEATCEAEGEQTRTCSVCNETETEKIPALGHKWDEGKVTTEATCTKKGVKTFTCQNDPEHTKTEEIPVTDHTFSKWESSETEHWRKCSECGKKETGKHKDVNNNGVCDICGAKVGKSDVAPKTGDPAPVKAVVTVLVISAVAVGAIALYLFLKKKKATDQ